MPKLIIDNIPVEVPDGVTVLEAAQSVGIPIPHFCWHPALGKAGACRVCAVKMLDGPVKGLQMSCMLPAQDGMVVSTTDEEAVAMRRQVIEWLMINHPHDCPVCDEGGECQLQDFTIAGGHGLRRYTGKKRTHVNQYLGPYIEHEMNRCIQCYRCVRFYQEFAGGTDFGVMGSAGRAYFGRFRNGQLESPFSGNLVDICPTGVFTDKTARFRARYWDYDMGPSVCPHCSLGCNTIPAGRYRELLKTMGRRNDVVNGWFICDRGRFSNSVVNDPNRPRYPLVDGRNVEWDEAMDHLLSRIAEIGILYGPESLAIIGSSRLSMEAAAILPLFRDITASGSLCYFMDEHEAEQTVAAVLLLKDSTSASMADVREADLIAIIDCNLLEEGPMMALAIRQAWCKGAKIYLVGKKPHPHPDPPLEGEGMILPFEYVSVATLDDMPLSDARNPVIITSACNSTLWKSTLWGIKGAGGDLTSKPNPPEFPFAKGGLKTACLFNGPNTFGAALLSEKHGATSLSRAVAEGKVKGIIAVEADIPAELLEGIPFVAALDWKNTDTVRAARIVLPTTAWVEMDGTYINNEGRAQRFKKVMSPGLPIKGLDPSGHPPRVHSLSPPGGDPLPAWKVLAGIIERLGGERIVEPFSGEWERLRGLDAEGDGIMACHGETEAT
jgi:NADH-quinone oxidoreductase subunit G